MVGLVKGDLWRLLSSFWRRLVHITDAIFECCCSVSTSVVCVSVVVVCLNGPQSLNLKKVRGGREDNRVAAAAAGEKTIE